jgi:phosphatidylserine/phosphatidylglycerophosphate/cardiolipin synthase-like enzyme
MTSPLCLLNTETLTQLAGALRSGRLAPPFTPLLLRRYVPESLAAAVAGDLQRRAEAGATPSLLGDSLDLLGQDRRQRPIAEDVIELVWTGPEAPGIVNRDTAVVVREMFQGARESVLIAGFAVYGGQIIFRELADQMDQEPGLQVRMFLDIQRPQHDLSSPAELVREFGERFVQKEWPGRSLPRLYYDPRSMSTDGTIRASLHAKCVVVDGEQSFVSSANFTEAAQTRNIEVGPHLRSHHVAARLVEHFETLAASNILLPVPVGGKPA